jgi:hypothetical protein
MLFAATPVAAGDYEDRIEYYNGVAALIAGDYQKAFRLLKPLAEQGDAEAQALVGIFYAGGDGVPQNYVRAYAWLSIAAAQREAWCLVPCTPVTITSRIDLITNFMTPAQIAEAQKLSRELWEKYVVPFQKE